MTQIKEIPVENLYFVKFLSKYKEYNAWDCFFGGLEGVDVVPVDID